MKKKSFLTIRNKIILSNIILFGLCFVIMISSSYLRTSDILISQTEKSVCEELDLIYVNLSSVLSETRHVSDSFFSNVTLCSNLAQSAKRSRLEQMNDYYYLKPQFSELENSYTGYQIRVYLPDDYYYASEEVTFFPESEIVGESWYPVVTERRNGAIYWVRGEDGNTLSAIRILKNLGGDYGKIAVLSVTVPFSRVGEVFTDTGRLQQTYLIDENGEIVFGSDEKAPENFDFLSELSLSENQVSERLSVNGVDSMVIAMQVRETGWVLTAIVPYGEILSQSIQLRNYSIFFALLILLLSIVFSVVSLNRITKRINTLSQKMVRVEETNFESYIDLRYHDEFSTIEDQYNKMCVRIRALIEESYEKEIKKREAELRTLQAQINPHFLYNTLDTINWMAAEHDERDISRLSSKLGKFARLSLSKGKDIIPIRDELEITRLYLEIQQIRFGEYLSVEYDVEDGILDCLSLKLVLQPLVENAIKHGFQTEKLRKGKIVISGKEMDRTVQIEITDNGVGFSGSYDLSQGEGGSEWGYGLQNINERMGLYYNKNYTFRISGEPGKGTKVVLRWPVSRLFGQTEEDK